MKVVHLPNTAEVFRPVTLQLTFESMDELVSLWHRVNLNCHRVAEHASTDTDVPRYRPDVDTAWSLYHKLSALLKECK